MCHTATAADGAPLPPPPLAWQVWKARRKGSLQTVAVKLITKHGKNEKDVRNLRQEIEILRKLRHENIIQMLDAFETRTDFCVVTEFAQGGWAGDRGRAGSFLQCRGGVRAARACTQRWRARRRRAQCRRRSVPQAAARCVCMPVVGAGELFQILEDDQSLPEEVVRR